MRFGLSDCSKRTAINPLFTALTVACISNFFDGLVQAAPTIHNSLHERSLEARAEAILRDTPLIDGHDDLAYLLRWAYGDHIHQANFTAPFANGSLTGDVDLYRLRKGLVGGTFWSIYVDCPTNNSFSPEYFDHALDETEAAIDVIQRILDTYPHAFTAPRTSADLLPIFHSNRIISPLGLEGLHMLGNSFARLRAYHAAGVRYTTLTHNCHNSYADSAMTDMPDGSSIQAVPRYGGISPLGTQAIRELNRLGILVDLSHVSADTMRSVLSGRNRDLSGNGTAMTWQGSLAPPIFSHSSAFALCPHPRNVPDDVLHLVKAKGGVVMVTFWAGFISCHFPNTTTPAPGQLPEIYTPNVTVTRVVEHMKYIGNLIGYEHVGVGSDFDGVPYSLPGLEDVSKFPNLVVEMLRQGISDEDAKKIVGGNLIRVWGEVDAVAREMRKEGVWAVEDELRWVPDPWT